MPRGRIRIYSDEERVARRRAAISAYKKTAAGKLKSLEHLKIYRQKYPWKHLSKNMNDHAKRMSRMPVWITSEHKLEIEQFFKDVTYLKALTKVKFEVDHIVPLQGEIVSGLHVPWNLQILTAVENRQKKNKFEARS